MLKFSQKFSAISLMVLSITTFTNCLIMYWLPIMLPNGSFSILRIVFVGFAEKCYYLVVIGLLLSVGLFVSSFSVRRKHRVLPLLSLIYLVFDCSMVFLLFAEGLQVGYGGIYVLQLMFAVPILVFLCSYCFCHFKKPR